MKTTFILTIFSAVMLLSCGKTNMKKKWISGKKNDKAMEEYEMQ